MKKLSLLVFVMALVVAFALPAFAYTVEGAKGERFTIGGTAWFDMGYRNLNKDLNAGRELTKLFAVDSLNSNLNGNFTVGNTSFNWVLYVSSDLVYKDYSGVNSSYVNYRDLVGSDVWFGTYRFGNCMLQAGKMANAIGTFGTSQTLGYAPSTGSHIASIGWGWTYDNKHPQLRFTQNISKQVGYHIALVNPGVAADVTGNSYATIPTIAAKLMLNFGAVSLYPAIGFQQLQFDNMPAGYDSSVTGWVARCPVQVVAGPFTGKFELLLGQNLGNGKGTSGWFVQNAYGTYQRSATGKVQNGNTVSGFVDLGFQAGAVNPHVYFGITRDGNKDYYTVGDNSNTKSTIGVNASIKVSPNFTVKPEVSFYDYGIKPGDAAKTKLGQEWLAGVSFYFSF